MLKHILFEGNAGVALINDDQPDRYILIDGHQRRIIFYARTPEHPAGIVIEGIPFAPDYRLGRTMRFTGRPREGMPQPGRMLVYGIEIQPEPPEVSGLYAHQLHMIRDDKRDRYTFSLHPAGGPSKWNTHVTFAELDKAKREALAQEGSAMPNEPKHPTDLTPNLVAHTIALMILEDEGNDTFSNDDAEHRPDASTLYRLAARLGMRHQVDDAIEDMLPLKVYTFDLSEGALSIQIDVRAKTEAAARAYLGTALADQAFAPFYSTGGERSEVARKYDDILDVRCMIEAVRVDKIGIELIDEAPAE